MRSADARDPSLCRYGKHLLPILLLVLILVLRFAPSAFSQTFTGPSQPLITQAINENSRVVLSGNTRPEAQVAANDLGIVNDSLPLPHMMLQLRRPAAQEQALVTLIDQLHDPKSPNYHHWLSAANLGAQFGPAASDHQVITGWLQQHGFTVNTIYPNGMVIDFSGTAGQIRTAFHTEIHNLTVNGVAHIANMSDPEIPAALAPAVVGIVSLHNFRPHPKFVHNPAAVGPPPNFTRGGDYWVAPPDLATIYNFNPLFNAGISGAGQTVYLIEDTDLYADSDWTTFRNGFGLALSTYPTASLTTIHPVPPSGPNNCSDPGVVGGPNGDDGEAILDAEYASAAAPAAAIVMVACANSNTVDGLLTAIENTVNGTNPPSIMSMSYGDCEANNGAANTAAYYAIYQTGVAQGMSMFVSAGDEGGLSCTAHTATPAKFGIGVDAQASSPYNVAVGGTDFADTYLGQNATYWNSANSFTHGSAISYMPEIPWNTTCGSQLWATFRGLSTTYGASGLCNSDFIINNADQYLTDYAGSGGPSGCATGTPSVHNVVSGTCAGTAKPSWQSGFLGNPADGVRDIPDVSLFASFGPWHHGYVVCFSDASDGGVACDGTNAGWSYDWGGTSFSSPIMAGVQALINQYTGQKQGNPNYRLYQLAAAEYGASGSSACNSSNGNAVSGACMFYDVTLGDDVVPCRADAGTPYNCYLPSGTNGVLSLSSNSYEPAFTTGVGWDFATGIGTVNVANLVKGWNGARAPLTDAHDFNGDDKSDILWRDNSGNLAIWEMNGGTILNPSNSGLGSVPTMFAIVGQRDFSGDGNADILWRDNSGNLAIWEMNGTTILNPSNSGLGNVPTAWSIVGTGDFNGDGYADILWRNTWTGDLAIWEMNGTTILNTNTAGLGNVPINWSVVGVGDFNGDGKADILWRNNTNGNVAIWLMNGTTVTNTSTAAFGNMPANWFVAGTGDFNGDGNSDILWRDGSGDIAIWEMNGTTVLNPNTSGVGSLSTIWTPAVTGDFNGDGKSDILWHDSSGDIAIWYMNGTAIGSGSGLGTMPTSWTIQGTNAD